MAYIGRPSIVGNFVKLDSITAVNGQAAYTMQNGGANFTDYSSVNQFMVSLNSVIQSPGSSFTVSGSTLTFASNLSTGDVIDFIIVFGNSLSAGVPTDATVTAAKLTANAITGQTAETSVATDDLILLSDTSASGALKKMTRANFVSGIGGDNTPAFSTYISSNQTLSDATTTKANFDTEEFDTDGAYDTSNKRFTVPSGEGGKYFFHARGRFNTSANQSQFVMMLKKNNNDLAKKYIYSGSSGTKCFNSINYFSYDISAVETLSAGDYIEVFVMSDDVSGNNITFNSGTVHSEFSGYKLIGV